jgi:peptidoglycan-associated lipoprotein
MRQLLVMGLVTGLLASRAWAQDPPPPAATVPIEQLRADFLAKTGGTLVYFGSNSAIIGAPARPMLEAQATWLRLNPFVAVKIEGHGDGGDTRDHALALGARRAAAVQEAYILLGVPSTQISISSWGKERPGPPRAEIRIVP